MASVTVRTPSGPLRSAVKATGARQGGERRSNAAAMGCSSSDVERWGPISASSVHEAAPGNGGFSSLVDVEADLHSSARRGDSDAQEGVSDALAQCRKVELVRRTEAPKWLRTDYIETGYRSNLSLGACVRSLLAIHNETINVWTHLVGFLYFAAQVWRLNFGSDDSEGINHGVGSVASRGDESADGRMDPAFVPPVSTGFDGNPLQEAHLGDCLAFNAFLMGSACCMLFSTCFHLFGCVSLSVHGRLYRLDLFGIALQTLGSFVVGLYYAFYCKPLWRDIYLAGVTLLLLTAMAFTLLPRFHGPQWTRARVTSLSLSVAFGLVPAVHWVTSTDSAPRGQIFGRLMAMFGFYGVGFALWASKYPEKLWPGKFDKVFHSHQLVRCRRCAGQPTTLTRMRGTQWHVAVFLAAWVWYLGCLEYFAWSRANGDARTCEGVVE